MDETPRARQLRIRVAHASARELRCPYCHAGLEPDALDSVRCKSCRALVHLPCWSELGSCASCRASRFVGQGLERGFAGAVRPRLRDLRDAGRDSALASVVVTASLLLAPVLALVAIGVLGSSHSTGRVFVPSFMDGGNGAPMSAIAANNVCDDRPARSPVPAAETRWLAEAALRRADDHLAAGDRAGGLREVSRALGYDPSSELARNWRAALLANLGG